MKMVKTALPAKHILLVDDERHVRETVKLLLCQQGHTVVEANNGAEALGLFCQARFDLVLTDFEMPLVKGNELALGIRRLNPLQPILMMTGFRHVPGPDNPVDAVISKPFGFVRLGEAMAAVLLPGGKKSAPASPAGFGPLS